MSWTVPRMWEGADVWILGGGPSMTKQFKIPKTIVQRVVDGVASPEIYSPYMKAIHDKHVIGINVAYMIGSWIDVVFFGDGGFFLKHKEALAAFPGLKVSCNPNLGPYHWVKFLARDPNHVKGITSNPRAVSWNHNSGAAAISLAANAGAKRIMLLGFDMKLAGDQSQHWHNLYGKMQDNSKRRLMHLPFDRHLLGFSVIAKDANQRGIEILNVSQDSAIEELRKVTLEEVL